MRKSRKPEPISDSNFLRRFFFPFAGFPLFGFVSVFGTRISDFLEVFFRWRFHYGSDATVPMALPLRGGIRGRYRSRHRLVAFP
jgi:hypothetical protein